MLKNIFFYLILCKFGACITLTSNFISFNGSPNCNIVYLENLGAPVNGMFLQGNATYLPSCPQSAKGNNQNIQFNLAKGYYCSPNFSQGTKLIQLNATQYTFKTDIPLALNPWGNSLNIFDTSSGLSNAFFTLQIPIAYITGSNFYCWNSTTVNNMSNLINMPTTAICYLVPILASQSTFCVYQNSVCDLYGNCYLDTLLDSYNFIPVYPFVPGVWLSANITYTLNPV